MNLFIECRPSTFSEPLVYGVITQALKRKRTGQLAKSKLVVLDFDETFKQFSELTVK